MEVILEPSQNKDKKWKASIYQDKKRIKTIQFGQRDAEDYTIHKDKERKEKYLLRHKNEQKFWSHTLQNLQRASYWSRWLTWQYPDLKDAIKNLEQQQNIKIILKQ